MGPAPTKILAPWSPPSLRGPQRGLRNDLQLLSSRVEVETQAPEISIKYKIAEKFFYSNRLSTRLPDMTYEFDKVINPL